MSRQFLDFTTVISTLAVVVVAANAQETMPKQVAPPESNQVYVKIILPTDPPDGDKDRVVESWVAKGLKKRGQAKFSATTKWVSLDRGEFESTWVWDGNPIHACPVDAQITEGADDHIKVLLRGWHPGGTDIIVSLTDEPGSRAIAAVEELKTEHGMPYVVVLIGPPPEIPAASTDGKK